MSDRDVFDATLKDLKSQGKLRDNVEYSTNFYPGAFYRNIFDNGQIRIYNRGQTSKIYLYPHFKPFPSKNKEAFVKILDFNSLVKTIEDVNLKLENRLEQSDECFKMMNEYCDKSTECWDISSECYGDKYPSNTCFDKFFKCREELEILGTKRNDCFHKLGNNS